MDTRRPPLLPREHWRSRGREVASGDSHRAPPSNRSVEQVYHDHFRRVYCLALRLVGNEADADDVAQEVLLQVVRKLDTFRGGSALTTWLHRVTVNAVLHLRRRRKHGGKQELNLAAGGDEPPCDVKSAPDQVALRKELRQRIDRAIARLPADYRAVYVAADLDGLGIDEISHRLGLSQAAVKSRLHRGRTRLRTILTPYVQGKPA